MVGIVAPTNQQLNALVEPYLANQPVGLAFVIGYASPEIDGYGDVYLNGTLVDQCQRPMTLARDTLFEIASVSKTFTATLYAYLLGNHDDRVVTVGDYFRDARRYPIGSQFYDITLPDLLSYTSGLPQDNERGFGPRYWPRPYTLPGMCGFLGMTDYQPTGTGKAYTYSNLGFALAAAVLQRMAEGEGGSFVDLVQRHLLAPLGMADTTYFGRTDIARLPLGYTYSSRTEYAGAAPGWGGFPSYNGAGGVVTSPRDMQVWLAYNMGIKRNEILTPLLASLQRPATPAKAGEHDLQLGLGWFLSPVDTAVPMVWKDGELAGCNSFIQFLQSDMPGEIASRAGVFVLTNASGLTDDSGVEIVASIAYDVLQIMQGGKPTADKPAWQRVVGRLPEI